MAKVTVEKPTKEKLDQLGIETWGRWESEVTKFDWEYDEKETFYVLEGRVNVVTDEGEDVEFGKGDLVTFPKGLKCIWNVLEPIKKVYTFK